MVKGIMFRKWGEILKIVRNSFKCGKGGGHSTLYWGHWCDDEIMMRWLLMNFSKVSIIIMPMSYHIWPQLKKAKQRYTNADLKISLHVCVHVKAIP